MQRTPFQGRILILGFGGVARCTLPLILRHIEISRERIIVLDKEDLSAAQADPAFLGVRFVKAKITQASYRSEILRHIGPGDLLIDLAWNLGCTDLLSLCREQDIRYVNTSVELWNPYENRDELAPVDKTLYVRQMAIRELIASWGDNAGATAVLDHGANPGLVSHFAKQGLFDLATHWLRERPADERRGAVEESLATRDWPALAQALDVKVIHVSESDTQVARTQRRAGEFLNTWSVEGFYEESIAPAELGWGTHEAEFPKDGHRHATGPGNQICLSTFGMNTFVRTRVPSGEITGMVIRHGEAFSLSDYLTRYDADGRAVYRPTVHYAYCPCDVALESVAELRETGYPNPDDWRILSDEIVSGRDELGVLLMGHDFQSWWTGTVLTIDEARTLVPGQNATTLQVAASVVGAVLWMFRNPQAGVLLPDALPYDEILEFAKPYLGKVVSTPIAWMPTQFRGLTEGADVSADEHWQFGKFRVEQPPRVRVPRKPVSPVESIPLPALAGSGDA
jgi:homospermidine synthase